jgi:hypothetical protein
MESLYSPNYNLCDDILKCLSENVSFPDVNIREKLREPDNQILEVLDILIRNGHIKRPYSGASVQFIIRGTQSGMDFYKNGGYQAQMKKDNIKEQYLIDLNKSVLATNASVRKTNSWMSVLTGALVIVAILSLLREIVKDRREPESEQKLQTQKIMQDSLQQIRQTFQDDLHHLIDSLKKK